MRMASDMSKEMLAERLSKSVPELAKSECDYLKYRACARGMYGRTPIWIDESVREWEKSRE